MYIYIKSLFHIHTYIRIEGETERERKKERERERNKKGKGKDLFQGVDSCNCGGWQVQDLQGKLEDWRVNTTSDVEYIMER